MNTGTKVMKGTFASAKLTCLICGGPHLPPWSASNDTRFCWREGSRGSVHSLSVCQQSACNAGRRKHNVAASNCPCSSGRPPSGGWLHRCTEWGNGKFPQSPCAWAVVWKVGVLMGLIYVSSFIFSSHIIRRYCVGFGMAMQMKGSPAGLLR